MSIKKSEKLPKSDYLFPDLLDLVDWSALERIPMAQRPSSWPSNSNAPPPVPASQPVPDDGLRTSISEPNIATTQLEEPEKRLENTNEGVFRPEIAVAAQPESPAPFAAAAVAVERPDILPPIPQTQTAPFEGLIGPTQEPIIDMMNLILQSPKVPESQEEQQQEQQQKQASNSGEASDNGRRGLEDAFQRIEAHIKLEQAARRAAEEKLAFALQQSTPSSPSSLSLYSAQPHEASVDLHAELHAAHEELQRAQAAVLKAETLMGRILQSTPRHSETSSSSYGMEMPNISNLNLAPLRFSLGYTPPTSVPAAASTAAIPQVQRMQSLPPTPGSIAGTSSPNDLTLGEDGLLYNESSAGTGPVTWDTSSSSRPRTLRRNDSSFFSSPKRSANRGAPPISASSGDGTPAPETPTRRKKEPWQGTVGGRTMSPKHRNNASEGGEGGGDSRFGVRKADDQMIRYSARSSGKF